MGNVCGGPKGADVGPKKGDRKMKGNPTKSKEFLTAE